MQIKIKNNYLNFLLKSLIALLVGGVIYTQVLARENAAALWQQFTTQLAAKNGEWLFFALLLMPLNWILEAMKWRSLVLTFEQISPWRAVQATMSGVTMGIFTPNRIGEYGGRVLYIKSENQWKAVIATLVGGFSQFLVIISVGVLGCSYYFVRYFNLEFYVLQILLFAGFFLTLGMLFFYFNIDLIIKVIKRIKRFLSIPFLEKYVQIALKQVKVLQNYTSKQLGLALVYAFLRYIVYTVQYYAMLRFFGIEVALLSALAGISTIFLVQSSLPLPPITGLLVRGGMAIKIWGLFTNNELSILATTFGLWLINVILPALIGLIFISNINILKSIGYEKDK